MELELVYSSLFRVHLHAILRFYDERNGSKVYSRNLYKKIHESVCLLSFMPEMGRQTTRDDVRILYVDDYGIEYVITTTAIVIADIFSCQTDISVGSYPKK